MNASTSAGRRRSPYRRGTAVGLGLVYGAGAGTAIAVAVAGAPALAIGTAVGAGLGLVAGAVVDQLISQRSSGQDRR